MRAFVIRYSDVVRCPTHRLDVGHYREGGMCHCFEEDGSERIAEAPKRARDAVT